MWLASEFLLPKLEHNIALKWSSTVSRFLVEEKPLTVFFQFLFRWSQNFMIFWRPATDIPQFMRSAIANRLPVPERLLPIHCCRCYSFHANPLGSHRTIRHGSAVCERHSACQVLVVPWWSGTVFRSATPSQQMRNDSASFTDCEAWTCLLCWMNFVRSCSKRASGCSWLFQGSAQRSSLAHLRKHFGVYELLAEHKHSPTKLRLMSALVDNERRSASATPQTWSGKDWEGRWGDSGVVFMSIGRWWTTTVSRHRVGNAIRLHHRRSLASWCTCGFGSCNKGETAVKPICSFTRKWYSESTITPNVSLNIAFQSMSFQSKAAVNKRNGKW